MQNQADKLAAFAADVALDTKFAAPVDWHLVAVGFGGQLDSQTGSYVFPDGSSAKLTGDATKPVSAY